MAEAPVAFVDVETTGLHADLHPIWEVGLITPDGAEHEWLIRLNDDQLRMADPIGLNIGCFHERHPQGNDYEPYPTGRGAHTAGGVVQQVVRLTHGCHLAGAVVSFDEERLRRLAWAHGLVPSWHYHLIDVETLAAGWLMAISADAAEMGIYNGPGGDAEMEHAANCAAATPPWDSNALSRAVGVNPDNFDRHTALGDARWARSIYQAVVSG